MPMKVFLSYRSKNANIVRMVTDALTRCGVDTWFAEYEVLPCNYDAFQANLKTELLEAVTLCSHGLVFTNNDWLASPHCRQEMLALQRNVPKECILEVQIPPELGPHQVYPMLADNRPLVWSSSLKELIGQIGRHWNMDVSAFLRDQNPRSGRLHLMPAFGASLELGDLVLDDTKSLLAANAYPGYQVAMFTGVVNGIKSGLLLMSTPTTSPVGELSGSMEDNERDWELYKRYRRYAANWEQEQGLKIRGCHLFWHNNRTHMALTYVLNQENESTCNWERRYTISIHDDIARCTGEVNLVFHATLKGPQELQELRFRSLCSQFECLAQSFEFATPQKNNTLANASIFAAKTAHLTAGLWLAYYCVESQKSPIAVAIFGAIIGILAADLVLFILRPLYRRLLAFSMPANVDMSENWYEHFSMSLAFWLASGPFLILGHIAGALTNILNETKLLTRPAILCSGLVTLVLICAVSISGYKAEGLLLLAAGAGAAFITLVNNIIIALKRPENRQN